jgi:hypothetical protein
MAGETLRVLSGSGAGTQIPLNAEFVIGRSETGMGNLAGDTEISRRHARFQVAQSGQVIVEDLGSTNGTHVNGQRVDGPRVLAPGDQITLGKTILQFDAHPAAAVAAPAAAAAPAATAAPPPTQPLPAAPAAPLPPVGAAAYGAGPGFAGGPISGPPGAVAPSSRPRWLPFAAIALAVLVIAGAVAAVIANSGSDNGKQPASQAAATPPPAQSTPAPSAPPQAPSVRSVPALEASLKSVLSGASTSGPRVTAVSCPSNAPSAAGSTFACQVAGQQGLAGTVTVTLKDSQRKAYKFKATLQGNGFTRTVSGTAG